MSGLHVVAEATGVALAISAGLGVDVGEASAAGASVGAPLGRLQAAMAAMQRMSNMEVILFFLFMDPVLWSIMIMANIIGRQGIKAIPPLSPIL